jgi:hypothetical protein
MKQYPTPEHLKEYGRDFFQKVTALYVIPEELLSLLVVTSEALDSYYAAKAVLDTEGMSYKTTSGQIKQRPEALLLKESRRAFFDGIRLLGLNEEGEAKKPVGRPGRFNRPKEER